MSDRRAVVHIFSSYNNVLMTATDLTGAETITTCSGGQVVKTASDSGGQFAATRAAERLADALREKEFTQLIIKYRAWRQQGKHDRTRCTGRHSRPDPCRHDDHAH